MPAQITVIGSLNIDLVTTTARIPAGGETMTASSFATYGGGKGANQAVAAARGSRRNPVKYTQDQTTTAVAMIGAVGSDAHGAELLASLRADTIDTSNIIIVDGCTTGVAVIIVEQHTGENRILLTPGANHTLRAANFTRLDTLGPIKPDIVILQLEIPLDTVLQILQITKDNSIPCILNPAPAVCLPDSAFDGLDHLILNESEAAILTGRATVDVVASESRMVGLPAFTGPSQHDQWRTIADEFLAKGVRNVIITLGANGAYCANRSCHQMIPSHTVESVIDTTGAGDTFVGVYAVHCLTPGYGSMDDLDLIAAVKAASRAASRTVEHAGAQSSIPWVDEVSERDG